MKANVSLGNTTIQIGTSVCGVIGDTPKNGKWIKVKCEGDGIIGKSIKIKKHLRASYYYKNNKIE